MTTRACKKYQRLYSNPSITLFYCPFSEIVKILKSNINQEQQQWRPFQPQQQLQQPLI